MAKRKVPSQVASGADTFSDNLVGRQITDGTSLLTNTNFAIDRIIPEKDSKKFRTSQFSDFLTLDDLNEETNSPTTSKLSKEERKKEIKFKSSKNNGSVSLFGSLKSRISASIARIIKKYPASILVDEFSVIKTSNYTAYNISYNQTENITTFNIDFSIIYNPLDVVLVKPKSNTIVETENEIRNFYSSYKKYIIDISGTTYNILFYSEPNVNNEITIKVFGRPFGSVTEINSSFLIRPNDGIVEEFYMGLDELESILLNRETTPKFNAIFKVPRDSFERDKTIFTDVSVNWPLTKDNWNIGILGLDFDNYINKLSDLADEIDNYKSNLFIRFMTTPQLFEFDSEDRRIESIFQLYGQNFDKVKKYIENIAYMRNVSYDGVKNVPDVLLKNLANTLGLSTVNLFNEKQIDELFYTRQDQQYNAIGLGPNVIDAEYEFYRRLLVNLADLYKSKGTRSSLEFFLKFLGAPEPLIKINEYIYKVIGLPKSNNLENEIYDVIEGVREDIVLVWDEETYTYKPTVTTNKTTFDRDEYPVIENSVLPRSAFDNDTDIFFQKGAGWYENTLDHRSSMILDEENSILTGRTKTIKTKQKYFTYGEDYFDVFRTLPGLDTGYELLSDVDNSKSHIKDNNSSLILNRKNISIHLSATQAIDYDIHRKSKELELTFGTLLPQTGVTFAEFLNKTLSDQIKNSHSVKYRKNYISLEKIYQDYITNTQFIPYNLPSINEFINKMSPYWTQVIDQFVPATTLWTGGNLIENSCLGRSKYQYKFGCQPKEFTEILYPEFETVIQEDLETILGDADNFRGLLNSTGVTYYPVIEIDGYVFSGNGTVTLPNGEIQGGFGEFKIEISGTTTTINTAKLYDSFILNDCNLSTTDDTKLPLVCDYKNYLSPDIPKIKSLWVESLTNLINQTVNKFFSKDEAGCIDTYIPYSLAASLECPSLPDSEPTLRQCTGESKKLIDFKFFIDVDGIEKVRFTSLKYGPNDCSVHEYFDYKFTSVNQPQLTTCGLELDFSTECLNGETTKYFVGSEVDCKLKSDITIKIVGNTIPIQDGVFPLYVRKDCGEINQISGYTLSGATLESPNSCTLVLKEIYEDDVIDLLFTDATNCDLKVKIEGLNVQYSNGNFEIEYVTDDIDYRIVPKIQYRETFNYGIKSDSTVLVYNGIDVPTTNINDYVLKMVNELSVGDTILNATLKTNLNVSHQEFKDGIINDNISFMFEYSNMTITGIECLGTIKRSLISGITQNNVVETFEILPTSRVKVYTNKEITTDLDGNIVVIKKNNYFFTERYPEELQIKPTQQEEPCCSYPKDYMDNGDYLITSEGKLIEVIEVVLDYCTPDLYFNLNVGEEVGNDIIFFNGNNNHQILLQHEYNEFSRFNTDVSQQLISVCCPEGYPTTDRIPGIVVCDLDNNISIPCLQ